MRCGSWCVVVALLSVVALYADGSSSSVVVDVQSPLKTELIAGGDVLFADFGRDAFGWAEMNLPTGEYIVRLGEKLDEKVRESFGRVFFDAASGLYVDGERARPSHTHHLRA